MAQVWFILFRSNEKFENNWSIKVQSYARNKTYRDLGDYAYHPDQGVNSKMKEIQKIQK